MPKPRADLLFIPKVSWTQGTSRVAVSYGALVGTPTTIVLLPRSGAETAGFTLELTKLRGGATAEELEQFVADAGRPADATIAALIDKLPDWGTRCVFPVAEMSRFEVFGGWKLWLGVSAALRIGEEPPTALRVPNKQHLAEMREMYAGALRK